MASIHAPSRLHLTLIDLHGRYDRIDGGVGLTLRQPQLVIQAKANKTENRIIFEDNMKLSSSSQEDYIQKIQRAIEGMNNFLGIEDYYQFRVKQTYPPHSGLGSGTQLSLAVGKLILRLNQEDLEASEIAKIVGRGGTSGIGVGSFDQGGFIIDGGHSRKEKHDFLPSAASTASPPPITARYPFPADWNIILVIPRVSRKVSGEDEVNIFQKYCPIPLKEVQELSHLLLMKMMPAVAENDLESFGWAVNHIQEIGFKKIEVRLQNPLIPQLMQELRSSGAAGVGMSSFGPTVYAITDTNSREIVKTAQEMLSGIGREIIITKAQNHGAKISG